MENSSVNPVTEAEVRNIAERLVTTFVDYSQQSKDLQELKLKFSSLEWRVDTLSRNNEELKGQIGILVAERDKARQEVQDVTSLLKVAEDEREKAKAELEQVRRERDAVQSRYDALNGSYSDLYQRHQESRTEVAKLRDEVSGLKAQVEQTNRDLDHTVDLNKAQAAKLERITKALQGVEEAKADASEEARADITAMSQPHMGLVEVPKALEGVQPEEPWWKKPATSF